MLVPLTTADVYRWLEDENQFIRPPKPSPTVTSEKPAVSVAVATEGRIGSFCGECGMDMRLHESALVKHEGDHPSQFNIPCSFVHRRWPGDRWDHMDMVDVRHLLSVPPSAAQLPQPPRPIPSNRAIVEYIDPKMTIGVRKIVETVKLPAFRRLPLLDTARQTRDEVDAMLAPHAVLAAAARHFLRIIVWDALGVSTQDLARVNSTASMHAEGATKRILTPSHLIRGVSAMQTAPHLERRAVFLCLARMGVALDTNPPPSERPAPPEQHKIKQEE